MKNDERTWSRAELKTYLLLLCANADFVETPVELRLIGSRVDDKVFDRIYNEFSMDPEGERLEKIETALRHHNLNPAEITSLKGEIQEVFLSNRHISLKEWELNEYLNKLLQ